MKLVAMSKSHQLARTQRNTGGHMTRFVWDYTRFQKHVKNNKVSIEIKIERGNCGCYKKRLYIYKYLICNCCNTQMSL